MAATKRATTRRADDSRSSTTTAVAVFLVLAAALFCVYGGSLDAPFVFDDFGTVVDNPSITRFWPLLGDVETPGVLRPPMYSATSGRPLVNLSFALNYHFSGLSPRGYHVVNLLMHVLAATLLWALVRRTLRLPYFGGQYDDVAGRLAFAVALLWALHPLVTEAVQYVTQRTELMVALFYLATLYCSLRYWTAEAPSRRRAWLTLAIVASTCGMASKEVMATAPLMVLLFERTFLTGSFRKALVASWPLYAGLAATWLVLLVLNISAPRGDTAGFGLGVSAASWWLTQSKVLWMYLKLCLWPWPLVIHYHVPYLDFRAAWPYALATVALAMLTLVLLWRRYAAGYPLACVFAILAPTLIVPITTEVAAERRMYLPLAALVTLAVVGVYALLAKYTPRWLSAAGAGALAMVLSLVGVGRLEAYRDPADLWRDALLHQPNNPLAHNNLGRTLFGVGDRDGALRHFQEAVRLDPNYDLGHFNLANVLSESGQPEQAIAHFREALRVNPNYVEAYGNMAAAYLRMGQPAEALNAVRAGIRVARASGQAKAVRHLEAWVQANRNQFEGAPP